MKVALPWFLSRTSVPERYTLVIESPLKTYKLLYMFIITELQRYTLKSTKVLQGNY